MNKNTPTPWHTAGRTAKGVMIANKDDKVVFDGCGGFSCSDSQDEINAEFVCLAVNSHEELLAACKAALNLFTDPDIGPDDVMPLAKIERQLIDAITRAE